MNSRDRYIAVFNQSTALRMDGIQELALVDRNSNMILNLTDPQCQFAVKSVFRWHQPIGRVVSVSL